MSTAQAAEGGRIFKHRVWLSEAGSPTMAAAAAYLRRYWWLVGVGSRKSDDGSRVPASFALAHDLPATHPELSLLVGLGLGLAHEKVEEEVGWEERLAPKKKMRLFYYFPDPVNLN